jgi:hypothetical protein
MARWRRDAGPEWPERLQRFREWEWDEGDILEAAEHYALRHAAANGLEEPLPADIWPGHMTEIFAYTHFRMKWARENGREQDLVDEMIQNRLERGRHGAYRPEDT